MKVGTFIDPYNRAAYSITRSLPEGAKYMGMEEPKFKKGSVRMELTYQIDYF